MRKFLSGRISSAQPVSEVRDQPFHFRILSCGAGASARRLPGNGSSRQNRDGYFVTSPDHRTGLWRAIAGWPRECARTHLVLERKNALPHASTRAPAGRRTQGGDGRELPTPVSPSGRFDAAKQGG